MHACNKYHHTHTHKTPSCMQVYLSNALLLLLRSDRCCWCLYMMMVCVCCVYVCVVPACSERQVCERCDLCIVICSYRVTLLQPNTHSRIRTQAHMCSTVQSGEYIFGFPHKRARPLRINAKKVQHQHQQHSSGVYVWNIIRIESAHTTHIHRAYIAERRFYNENHSRVFSSCRVHDVDDGVCCRHDGDVWINVYMVYMCEMSFTFQRQPATTCRHAILFVGDVCAC